MKQKVDIIVSCYNEENNILPYYDEIKKYLNDDKYIYNILYVNDGSSDKTYEKILEAKNDSNDSLKVSVISFTHNFGHEAAMCAGLDKSNADYLIFMDADLQNPPSKIPCILEAFKDDVDCILLRKAKYKSTSILKKMTSKGYYLFSKYILLNKSARDVSDFFAIDKKLAKKVRDNYRTRLRFIRSFVQTEANKIDFIDYDISKRYSGNSRYNYLKLTKLAIISELSRSKFLRDKYKESEKNPIYIIDKKRSFYE